MLQPMGSQRVGCDFMTTDLSDVLQSGKNKMKQKVFKKSVFKKKDLEFLGTLLFLWFQRSRES